MEKGTFVRHASMAEWGFGVVSEERSDSRYLILWENYRRGELVLLPAERLVRVDTADVSTEVKEQLLGKPKKASAKARRVAGDTGKGGKARIVEGPAPGPEPL
jgi:hypothetical protein